MKRITLVITIIISTSAFAGGDGRNEGRRHHGYPGGPAAVSVGIANSRASALSASKGIGQANNSTHINIDQGDNVPSVNAWAPAPTVSCYKTGGLSFNLSGIGAGLGGGTIDKGCERREYIRLGQVSTDPGVRALASRVLREQLDSYLHQEETPDAGGDQVSNLELLGIR